MLCYATAKLLRDEAESMVLNIDPEQVRKLAGWGLTQNDILPRQESFASLHILTRRASEGSEALPSLAHWVRMSFFVPG